MTRTNCTSSGGQEGEGASRRPSPTRSSSRRPSTYEKRTANNLDCNTCDMALNIVARKVEVEKANNGGVLKYNAMTDIVNSMKPTLPWLTKGMLRNHINKLNKKKTTTRDDERPPDQDVVASATANDAGESTATLSTLTPNTGVNSDMLAEDTITGATSSEDEDNVGGRPKGSSANSKRHLKQRERLAKLDAT